MRKIGYNSQRNNHSFGGKFRGSWQCYTTSAWMFMSFYTPNIVAEDDEGLMNYFDDVEDSVGKVGIGEKIKRKFTWISGSTSYWPQVQCAGIDKYLWRNGVKGTALYFQRKQKHTLDKIDECLKYGPVIIGTNKLGGLKGGHIILLVDKDNEGNYIVHDPYGNALKGYAVHNGAYVRYSKKWLEKYTGKYVNFIIWR